jgi:hypothetical protein
MSIQTSQDAFAPHFKEIARRRDVTGDVHAQTDRSQFERNTADTGPETFVIDDQRIALLSIAHREFAPRSPNQRGWVRLYGAFESKDDASRHAQAILVDDPGISMLTIPTHEWILIACSPERFVDADLAEDRREEMLEMNRRQRERDAEEFQEHRKQCVNGDRDDAPRVEEVDEDECTTDAEVKTSVPPGAKIARGRLGAGSLVTGQRIAAISHIVPEDDSHGEFLLKVYACFDTMAEADVWVRNVAAPRVQDVHIDIVDLCRWVEPAAMKAGNAPKELFRNNELDKIMTHRKDEPARVEEYREWKRTTEAE